MIHNHAGTRTVHENNEVFPEFSRPDIGYKYAPYWWPLNWRGDKKRLEYINNLIEQIKNT
jgi:hypothetical protein